VGDRDERVADDPEHRVGNHVLDAADVVRHPRHHVAGTTLGEERHRLIDQRLEQLPAQPEHDVLADQRDHIRLGDADQSADDHRTDRRTHKQQHVPEPRIGTAEVIDQRPEHHGGRELERHPDGDARQHQQATALVRREVGEHPPQQRARDLDPPVLAPVDGHTRAYAVLRHADSVSASGRSIRADKHSPKARGAGPVLHGACGLLTSM